MVGRGHDVDFNAGYAEEGLYTGIRLVKRYTSLFDAILKDS
jgi:hypothetical protein